MTKWLDIARAEMGVTEKSGKASHPRILEYFEAAGHGEVKSDETAWCSAFANFCMEEAGIKGTMSLAARSWLRWGKEVKPRPGAVMVFKRGTSSWQGHVTFLVRETPTHYECLGGNQGNQVKITSIRKDTLIGCRWPSTMTNSRTVSAMAVGSASTGASFLLEQAQEAQAVAASLQDYVQWGVYAAVALTIVCFGLGMWFRWKDIEEKGR